MITNITGSHLTATNVKYITEMLKLNMLKGGSKSIQYVISNITDNEYNVKVYEKYAKSSRNFDGRPESNVVKWHFEKDSTFKVK